ncbi:MULTISPECIES: methyltransferase domain-containing protein [unclassified Pseudodesulfovibrio]|uniref:class I SAM-dependent methyltransferase n=1 Tax=unclassified Pseudodesulfovibrio TaxID=2661612 RepID=UPI000FEBB201|nr:MULTISPECIES: methyltransferase domain-containing protein [unclassified Pseudodesulfovibrio]MCJ2163157.1 methyltransferase domain-containing protein [Pseudodesulfovibrio sp. S3-i]RWU07146.1 methyltransferase domain-containing protein [Pseudodesulfovibrio sp. S3]
MDKFLIQTDSEVICPSSAPGSRVEVEVEGRVWHLDRAADMEALWDQMDDGDLDEDERLPYWAEVWPASVLLGRHILRNADRVRNRPCLDLGCGLGLTGMIAASVGAQVIAFDYEWPAVRFARHNAGLNKVSQPLWLLMDWRQPAVRAHSFDFIWGGDVLYEKRFFEPLIELFRHALAPGGRIWIGEPVRTVSRPVWDELRIRGFSPEKLTVEKVALCGQNATVNLWEITIP